MDESKVNPRGGAIAFGHPLGATGARQVVTALSELRRQNKRIAVTSMCVGTVSYPTLMNPLLKYSNHSHRAWVWPVSSFPSTKGTMYRLLFLLKVTICVDSVYIGLYVPDFGHSRDLPDWGAAGS